MGDSFSFRPFSSRMKDKKQRSSLFTFDFSKPKRKSDAKNSDIAVSESQKSEKKVVKATKNEKELQVKEKTDPKKKTDRKEITDRKKKTDRKETTDTDRKETTDQKGKGIELEKGRGKLRVVLNPNEVSDFLRKQKKVAKEPEEPQNAEICLTIDEDEDEYLTLANSKVTGSLVQVDQEFLENCVGYNHYNEIKCSEIMPGVRSGLFDRSDNVVTGVLRIDPRTVKPLQMSRNVRIIYWVLAGSIRVKSSATVPKDGQNVLYSTEITLGNCLIVPPYTMYTMENRSQNTDAVLSFVSIEEAAEEATETELKS